ncbi:MAG: radical SAM protein [Lachnospiraceae bacterium]|nr:radical SAM protein [Lachnospiraceae bacterium]
MSKSPSRFNCFRQVSEDSFLVLNTLSRKLVLLRGLKNPDELMPIFQRQSEQTCHKLCMDGIICDRDEEWNQVLYELRKREFGNDVVSVTVLPTMACNFRCRYCYQDGTGNMIRDDVLDALGKYIRKNVRNCRVFRLNWFGGEPTLCIDKVVRFTEKARSLCVDNKVLFTSHMTTNGYGLDAETFMRCVSAGIRYYQITIDGPEEIHNYQRPHVTNKDSFQVVINNLKQISQIPRNHYFEIGIRINVSAKSAPLMDDFIDSLARDFGDDRRFVFVWQWVRDWGGERIADDKENLIGDAQICTMLYELSVEKGLSCATWLMNSGDDGGCDAKMEGSFTVDPEGNVYKCSMHLDDPINRAGNLHSNGAIHWNSSIVPQWHNGEVKVEEKCETCPLFPICRITSCPYREIKTGSNICMEYRDMIQAHMLMLHRQNKSEVICLEV